MVHGPRPVVGGCSARMGQGDKRILLSFCFSVVLGGVSKVTKEKSGGHVAMNLPEKTLPGQASGWKLRSSRR
jgi:hypothetical protein